MIELPGYQIDREIGRGAFATVYLAHAAGDLSGADNQVAIKAVRTATLTRKLAEALAAEIAILRSLTSPHIIKLMSIERRDRLLFLVMEYCPGGDLAAFLRGQDGGRTTEARAKSYIRQLAVALRTLQRASLIHRDIKPQNLLLSADYSLLKLADFGFARYVEEDNLAETLCGSPLYMAPEILRYEKYDERADLWSVGAVLFEMLFGRPPFRAQNHIQLLKVIEQSEGRLDFPHKVSESAESLIRGLLKVDPRERMEYSVFLSHPFLADASDAPCDDDLFDTHPIPIGAKKPSLPSALSSSPKSLVSTAFSRRRSVSNPHNLTPSNSSILTASSREQLCLDDEQIALTLPALSQTDVRKGIVLSELMYKCDNPLVAMQALKYLLKGFLQLDGDHSGGPWLQGKLREAEERIDFDHVPSAASSNVPDYKQICSILLYDYSIRIAIEGGFQELLGRLDIAKLHYGRAHFVLDAFSPLPLVGPVIEEYRRAIEERLLIVNKKMEL